MSSFPVNSYKIWKYQYWSFVVVVLEDIRLIETKNRLAWVRYDQWSHQLHVILKGMTYICLPSDLLVHQPSGWPLYKCGGLHGAEWITGGLWFCWSYLASMMVPWSGLWGEIKFCELDSSKLFSIDCFFFCSGYHKHGEFFCY